MNVRTIRRQIVAFWQGIVSPWSRRAGLGVLISSVLGFSVLAQSTTDFIDPLKDERVRIEKGVDAPPPAPIDRQQPARTEAAQEANSASLLARARQGASSGADAAQEQATGFWARTRSSISDLAARMGLPVAGLLGLLALALVALALLLGWTLFRGKGRHRNFDGDDDVYARSRKDVSARRKPSDPRRAASSAEAAPVAFREKMPDDFDAIFAEEADDTGFDHKSATRVAAARSDDTSTWRKPNLDRLRDSIKADWKADKKRDDDTPVLKTSPRKAVATPLADTDTDPGELSLTEMSDGWEDWDSQAKPDDDPWGESLAQDNSKSEVDDSATRRIRALRESLRAS